MFHGELGSDDSAEVLRVSLQDLQALGATAFNPMAVSGFQDSLVTSQGLYADTVSINHVLYY